MRMFLYEDSRISRRFRSVLYKLGIKSAMSWDMETSDEDGWT